eukprot:3507364-Pyramimonas_sp.AAC.1
MAWKGLGACWTPKVRGAQCRHTLLTDRVVARGGARISSRSATIYGQADWTFQIPQADIRIIGHVGKCRGGKCMVHIVVCAIRTGTCPGRCLLGTDQTSRRTRVLIQRFRRCRCGTNPEKQTSSELIEKRPRAPPECALYDGVPTSTTRATRLTVPHRSTCVVRVEQDEGKDGCYG